MRPEVRPVVIAGYARSPFHLAGKGALARVRPDDLAAQVVAGLVARAGLDPKVIEDLIVGCAFPEGEQGFNVGRLIGLIAGLPIGVGGMTVNRFCGSSMSAIHYAAGQIALGAGDVFLAAGVESMSRVPMMGFNPLPNPALAKVSAAYMGMGETAEKVAAQYGISRAAQEAFAVESQRRAGAAAVIVAAEEVARAAGLPILARVRSVAISGCLPETMGLGPIEASRKALARAGITAADLDVIELNEAFASQSLACIADLKLDPAKVNIDGGAIAIGHPLGATGARITGKAASLLARTGGKYALATQCIGGGQGIATVLEAI